MGCTIVARKMQGTDSNGGGEEELATYAVPDMSFDYERLGTPFRNLWPSLGTLEPILIAWQLQRPKSPQVVAPRIYHSWYRKTFRAPEGPRATSAEEVDSLQQTAERMYDVSVAFVRSARDPSFRSRSRQTCIHGPRHTDDSRQPWSRPHRSCASETHLPRRVYGRYKRGDLICPACSTFAVFLNPNREMPDGRICRERSTRTS